jgi:hypothetical protein
MDLARMRIILGRYLGLEGGLDPTDADEALNWNYQYALPNLIGGAILEGYIDIVTVAGTQDYDIDVAGLAMATPVVAKNVYRPVINTNTGRTLRYTEQPIQFWTWHEHDATDQYEPRSVLVRGRSVSFRPIPDAVYTYRIYGQVYRGALTAAGIGDEEEALLICAMAALDMGEAYGRDETVKRAEKAYSRHYDLVYAKYNARSGAATSQSTMDDQLPAVDF